jgi:hypothetical protein
MASRPASWASGSFDRDMIGQPGEEVAYVLYGVIGVAISPW